MKAKLKKSVLALIVILVIGFSFALFIRAIHPNKLIELSAVGKDEKGRYVYEASVNIPHRGEYFIYLDVKDINIGFASNGIPKIAQIALRSNNGQISCFDPIKAALIFDSQKNAEVDFTNTNSTDSIFEMQNLRYRFSNPLDVDVKIYSLNLLDTSNAKLRIREKLDSL